MKEMRDFNVKVEESRLSSYERKNSKLFKHIPRMTNICMSVVILIINIFLPGVGTMILGCTLPKDLDQRQEACYGLVGMGALQIILVPCVIGWIWSIIFGIMLVQISCYESRMH